MEIYKLREKKGEVFIPKKFYIKNFSIFYELIEKINFDIKVNIKSKIEEI